MIADLQLPLSGAPVFDELTSDGVNPRPHWKAFIDSLRDIDRDEMSRRWSHAQRRIRENGVTYNVYSDPLGASRPWELDALPLIISTEEWSYIEAGIIQRADLLNRMLADLYGPQRLISQGSLPSELLFANPAFLRPLAGARIPKHNYIMLLAVDLARSPDGQWWVLSDRTEAPSGSGYALENRLIIGEMLPDQFRESNVRRLAPFFRALRDAMIGLAPANNPRAILLTPGRYNETYFEHAYLARYLQFALVEGADLTVRNRHVFLKTVEGLQQVDVIHRRTDASFCDPLELRGESVLGIPGLVDAIHAGNVSVSNALGSGVIETAAIMPFLPGLAQQVLGERLKLPSVATWWCGQEYARDWVLRNLNRVVLKPAFPSRGMEPVFGADLIGAESEKLSEKLRARPFEYVAQEQVQLSIAPVLDRGALQSRSLVLRTYVVNTGDGWMAMPGGLARVSGPDGRTVSMQRGGLSKDVWVLSDRPVEPFSLLRPKNEPVELRRQVADLPSRAADNLFWLGRYAERSESIVRLLRTIALRLRRAGPSELACLFRLMRSIETKKTTLPDDREPTASDLEREVVALVVDTERGDSIFSNLEELHRVGSNVQERLSEDMTRLIGRLADIGQTNPDIPFVEIAHLLSSCIDLLTAFAGMERENITRGAGWLFLSLGRRLERAMYIVRQLREVAAPLNDEEWPLLDYLLEVADSSITYRSRYFTTLQPAPVLDVLMADETNPRSLAFQVSHIADLYAKLPRHVIADARSMRKGLDLLRGVNLQDLDSLKGRTQLARVLALLDSLLPRWADNVVNTYFSHAHSIPIRIGG